MFHSFVTAQMPLKVSLVSQCGFELGHELNIKPYTETCTSLLLLTVLSGHVDIEVETILTLVGEVRRSYIQVSREPGRHHISQHAPLVQRLRANGSELRHISYSWPGQRWLWRLESPVSRWGPRIWHSQVLDDGAQEVRGQWGQDATDATLHRGDDRHSLLCQCRVERKGEAEGEEQG